MKTGTLKMKKPLKTRLTYHDACSLSRLSEPWTPYEGKRGWMGCVEPRLKRRRGTQGMYAQPRDILKAIPGVELVEMPQDPGKCLLLRRRPGYPGSLPGISELGGGSAVGRGQGDRSRNTDHGLSLVQK